ncbi:hypothetical protein [uncultured Leclercia sp.]|uniref:hypothetical protein n=1 Tax=uncultured Leclercia sp. TaxID=332959 RepID=UPI002595B7CA|nr:hypothetical protein [uncultured Leclercia sp.]
MTKSLMAGSVALALSMASAAATARDVVSLKFSDGRPDVKGVEAVNQVLHTVGINVTTVDIPAAVRPILETYQTRALDQKEQAELIKAFNLTKEQLLEQIKLAGRQPSVAGGGVMTEETGVGPYPKVYDMKALDKATHKHVLEKYGRLHINSTDEGDDIDEVMTVVNGGPFRWGFTLKDGTVARFEVDYVGLNDKAVRVSYHGKGMHAGIMDAKEGMIVAFAHGPESFTMRYDAPKKDIPHEELLGTNPWIDFKGDYPTVLDKAH